MLAARLVALCSLACTLALTVPAVAQPSPANPVLMQKARAHVDVARLAYNLGKFDEALRAYEAAYRLVPMPGLLFNLGQCHRHAGNHQRAAFFFDGYLREASPGPEQRAMVMDLKKESEAKLAAAAKAPPPATPPPIPPPVVVSTPVPPALVAATAPPPKPKLVVQTPKPTPEPSEGLHTKWWFWTLVGVGVAAAGTGTAMALAGGSQADLPSGSLGTVDWR